jgi:putative tryptophan/tyrosine transport system substrate-binding protein
MNGRRRVLGCAVAGLLIAPSRLFALAQGQTYRVGYLSPRATRAAVDDAFFLRMRELGYAVGRNLLVEYRWAGNDLTRLQPLADELARLNVDVIVTATTAGTRAAMRATRTIPIVMAATADPVSSGLIASLGKPGGNVTGMSLQTTDVARKRLELMREILPAATRIALLAEDTGPVTGTTKLLVEETQAAAKQVGVGLVVQEVTNGGELGRAFARYRREQAQGLIVQVSPLTIEHRATIVELAARERLPAMYEVRNFVDDGGFISYGPDLRESYRRAATYVDRILKGTRPADLPVEQPNKLELVINMKTATALGLVMPPTVLVRADQVIER